MPDRNAVIRKICWSDRMDAAALAAVSPAVLSPTLEKLAQPLANFLILSQVMEKEGLWDMELDKDFIAKLKYHSDESKRIQEFNDSLLAVFLAIDDIPNNARPALLVEFIPRLEKEIVKQIPGYRYLVYETRQAVKGREETKKENVRQAKTENSAYWVIILVLVGLMLFVDFKYKGIFELNTFSSRYAAAASGWGKVWVALGIPLAILSWTAFLTPVALLLASLYRKAANLMKPIEFKQRSEEQNWVWLCQRCQHLEPFLAEDDLDCPNCGNRMTQVRGQWGH